MNKRIIGLLVVILALVALGCGYTTEVPPAHVGKIQESGGLSEKNIPPSKVRLTNWCLKCPDLILAETSDHRESESLRIFMPIEQLNLEVEVTGIFQIRPDQADAVFARIPAEKVPDTDLRVSVISMEKVYDTYAAQVVREATRSFLSDYKSQEIISNREVLGAELHKLVREKLKDTPIQATQFGFADIQPPLIIVAANEEAKKRSIEIEKAKADKLVALEQADARVEVARKNQEADLIEAETQVLVNLKLAESVSDAFIAQRSLRILSDLAKSGNTIWVLPVEALGDNAIKFAMFSERYAPTGVSSVEIDPDALEDETLGE